MQEISRRRHHSIGRSVAVILFAYATTAAAQGPAPSTNGTPPTATQTSDAEQPARKMTLTEAIAFARSHQLRLLAARQRLTALERDADVPGAQWLPRLGAFAEVVGATTNNSTTTLINNGAVDVPRIGATKIEKSYDLQPYPSTAVVLGVRQELYDFGRIAAERAAVALAAQVEKYRVANVGLDVDFAVEQAYYAVLAARAVADASRNAYERSVTHRDFARANVASGLRPPIELTRAEADCARYEAGMVRATGGLHVARGTYAAVVGVDDSELDAAGTPPDTLPLPPLADLLVRAGGSPVVRESRARVEAQRAETRRLEAQSRPNLFATAAINGRAGGATPSSGPVPSGAGWLPVVPNYDVGVVLSWSPLDPTWDRRADASRERERAFELEEGLAVRNQRAVVAAAWQDAEVATKTLAALERGTAAARANYEQAENRFKVGLGTSTELADAQAVRTEADIQLAIGRFQMARARAALERAVAEVR